MEQDGFDPQKNGIDFTSTADIRPEKKEAVSNPYAEILQSAQRKQNEFLESKGGSSRSELQLTNVYNNLTADGILRMPAFLEVVSRRLMSPAEAMVLVAQGILENNTPPKEYSKKIKEDILNSGPLSELMNSVLIPETFSSQLSAIKNEIPGADSFRDILESYGLELSKLAKEVSAVKSSDNSAQAYAEANARRIREETDGGQAVLLAEMEDLKKEMAGKFTPSPSNEVSETQAGQEWLKGLQESAKIKFYENFTGNKWADLTPEQQSMSADELINLSIESKAAAAKQSWEKFESDYEVKRQERGSKFKADQEINKKEIARIEAELAALRSGQSTEQTPASQEYELKMAELKKQREAEIVRYQARRSAIMAEIEEIKARESQLLSDLEKQYGNSTENISEQPTAETPKRELTPEAKANIYNQMSGGDNYFALTEEERSKSPEELIQLAIDRKRQKIEDGIEARTRILLQKQQSELDNLDRELTTEITKVEAKFGKTGKIPVPEDKK